MNETSVKKTVRKMDNVDVSVNRRTEKPVSDDKLQKQVKEVILLSGLKTHHTCKQRC